MALFSVSPLPLLLQENNVSHVVLTTTDIVVNSEAFSGEDSSFSQAHPHLQSIDCLIVPTAARRSGERANIVCGAHWIMRRCGYST